MRTEKLTPRNRDNARAILEESPRLVEALIKQAYMARLPTGWNVITDLIQFQQRLYVVVVVVITIVGIIRCHSCTCVRTVQD